MIMQYTQRITEALEAGMSRGKSYQLLLCCFQQGIVKQASQGLNDMIRQGGVPVRVLLHTKAQAEELRSF